MLTDLCQELHNWFNNGEVVVGDFTIAGGEISLPFLQDGQYYRICGSVFNDGVHLYPSAIDHFELADESFSGSIMPMKIPPAVIALSEKIDEWRTKNEQSVLSPFQSESWGGYSYSLKSGSGESGSNGWQKVFASELNRWRKMQ